MTARLLFNWDAENGVVGQKPPPPLTAVTGPNIPLIAATPVFGGTKSYEVFLDKSQPIILGAEQVPYRTEMRGDLKLQFDRIYWMGFAFRREEWDTDTSAENFPIQIHEAPSNWLNWGKGDCQQSAASTAPLVCISQNGQMRLKNLTATLWTKPVDIGVWHTVVLQVKISQTANGFIRSWYDGVEQTRYPASGFIKTHRANSELKPACTPVGEPTVVFITPLVALGIYKWDWKIGSTQVSLTTRRRAYIDQFKAADDIAGNDDAGGFAMVTPGGAPDTTAPVISAVTQSVTSTTATIGFTTNESATTVIDYGTSTSYGTQYNNASLVTQHTAVLSNLLPNTTYQYRIRSADASGNTRSEANRTFQTASSAQAVTNVVVSNLTQTSATIDWDTPSAMSSVVNYGTTTSYGTSRSDPTQATHHSLTLTGLSPYVTYNYQLSGTGASGSALSANLTFRTLSAITALAAVALSATSQRITWTTTRATVSVLSYGTTLAYGQSVTESAASTSHSITLTNLSPGTAYNYAISGDDGVGTANLTFSTVTVPEGISGVTVARTSTTLTPAWTTSGASTTKVYWGLTKSYELGSVTDSGSVTSHSITVSGLIPSTWYHLKIESVNSSGAISTEEITPRFTRSLSDLKSDSFTGSSVQDFWTLVDPQGDSSGQVTGGALNLSVAAGVNHDYFTGALFAPRYRQVSLNTDFDIQTYLGSTPSVANQGLGFLIEQDASTAVRFSFGYNGSTNNRHFYCASFTGGVATTRYSANTATQTYPVYLRLKRTGNNWTAYRSLDAITWISLVSFDFTMTANFAGLLVMNAATFPAFTGVFSNFLVDAPPSGTLLTMDYVEPDSDIYEIALETVSTLALDYLEGTPQDDSEDIVEIVITTQKIVPSRAHNRVAETTTSVGSGALVLLGKLRGHKAISDRYAVNESMIYGIEHETADEFEIGQGHLSAAGTFIRDICEESSNGDDFVNFSAGVKKVYCCADADLYNELQAEADRV